MPLDIQKIAGFKRIYQAASFPREFDDMFKKSAGEKKRYAKWLYTWLTVLDNHGTAAMPFEQFEYLRDTESPRLYAIRHPRSLINERYIFAFADEEAVILLTAFKEQNKSDYKSALERAVRIYSELEED
jgi:hypothetical protein